MFFGSLDIGRRRDEKHHLSSKQMVIPSRMSDENHRAASKRAAEAWARTVPPVNPNPVIDSQSEVEGEMLRPTTTPDPSRLRELASMLPEGLQSDWRDTNHYELTDGVAALWLAVFDGARGLHNPCDTEEGQRLGLLMDIAAEVGRLRDETDLLKGRER